MTKHDPQVVWRIYADLPPHEKVAMRLKALIGDAIARATFVEVLAATRTRSPDRRPWSARNVQALLETLRARGLLEDDFACAAALRHRIAVEAAEGEQRVILTGALGQTLPRSDREQPKIYYSYHRPALADDHDLFRRVRLAIYANDEAEFVRLCRLIERENDGGANLILAALLSKLPGDIPWLERRAPTIRDAIVLSMVLALLESETIRADTAAAVVQFSQQAASPLELTKALLRRDLLSGNFDAAVRRVAALPPDDITVTSAHAVIDFLTGRNARAVAGFRDALKQVRKRTNKRKCMLEAEAGVFHVLALLREGDPRLHGEIRNLLDAGRSNGSALWAAYQALEAMLDVVSGQDGKAGQTLAKIHPTQVQHPLGAALVSLAGLHINSEVARARAAKDEAAFDRIAAHLPVVGRIHAEILAKVSPQRERWRAMLVTMGMNDVIAFTDVIGFKPTWERAFDKLVAFLAPPTAKPADASAAPSRKRLVFVLDPHTNRIEALEQTSKSGTWTSGRSVAMKRLYDQDPQLDYLTAEDRRVLLTIRKHSGWYGAGEYAFDESQTLLTLIGHPNVFDARDRSRRVELVAYPAELVVTETPKGYSFTLSHHAAEPAAFIEEERPGRWRVIEVSQKLVDLQGTLGEGGLTVPPHMRERLIPLLRTDNPTLPIRSELADVEVAAIDGVTTPVLQLRRCGEGLSVGLIVRPLGAEGPSYVAGQGGRSILAVTNGARQRVNRDLAAETAAAENLVGACPTLQAWESGDHEWRIEDLEAALAFLEEVQSVASAVAFEWPDGEALKVSRLIGAKNLSLKVAGSRDWFEITGTVAVDENLVLDMQDVLAQLDKARGRFVPLDGGRFLTLTEDLKRQLKHLYAVSEETAQGRLLHGLGAMAIDELVEDAGKVETDQRWRDQVAKVRSAGTHQPVLPSTLQAELRDYQHDGFVWLSRLAHLEMGACLADDMGLGKTVQAIAVLLERADRGASLVVAPTSVCHNWEKELARFAPTLEFRRLAAAPDRRRCVGALGPGEVLIASYGLLHQEGEILAARAWNVVVFDEAQNLKNAETKRAQASQKLDARFRVALSGTPVENYLEELWSLFNTINPGLLGSRERFSRRFASPIGRGDPTARNALRALVRPFMLRRTKSAVLSELPPRTELVIEVSQSEEERAFYEAMRRQALATLAALDGPSGQRKIHILAEITRLRRACCHPGLIDPGTRLESAKLRSVLDLIDELLRNRHKALVFSQFTGHLEKVREALDQRGIRYQYIDGAVSAQQRAERVAAFQGGGGDLFLISLKAGGTGLNLTAADYVIHLDPWWNPAVEDQASDRAHRIGQSRPVTVYRLIVVDTIEERILDLHRHKRNLAADLLEGAETSARLTEEELIELIQH